MKIMKVVDKKVGDTTYYKYRINLPKELVEDLNLLNKRINVKREENKIILEKEEEPNETRIPTEREMKIQKELAMLIKKRKNN